MDIGHLRSFVFLSGQVKRQRIKKNVSSSLKQEKPTLVSDYKKNSTCDDDRHRAVMCIR